tara:strand:+ start:10375 stop:11466 length:1092 start_codon:yes stop_codon:yes gene_type:complete
MDRPSVLVIGAGIVGSSVAYYLTCLKAEVHLIDRSKDPSETTRASLGVLTHFEGGRDDYSSFYRDGHALHAELATQLADETGIDVGWRALGGFDLAFGDKEVDFLKQWLAVNGAKCECEWVDAQQLRSAESQISSSVCGGVYFPHDHRVDPSALNQALRHAAVKRGAKIHLESEILHLKGDESSVSAQIRTEGGMETLWYDFVIIAAGSWTGLLSTGMNVDPSIRPIRGQHCRYEGGEKIRHVLRWNSHYLIPSWSEIIVGATIEEVGFDLRNTESAARQLDRIFEHLLDIKPVVTSQWSGLRPKPRKGRPVIGPIDDKERVFIASGHYKNGVILGPITGQVVADWIVDGRPPRDMLRFGIAR